MGVAPGRSWTSIDWTAHQRWARLDGHAVNVVELGAGDAVVFVHGLGGAWQNWLENLPVIGATHRAIALDLPGFGSSPLPSWQITIPRYAALVRALLDDLGIERATLVGNSMGGFVSTELALSAPDRVARLVLVSPAGLSIQEPEATRRLRVVRLTQPVMAHWNRFVARHAIGFARRARLRHGTMGYATARPQLLDPRLVAEHVRWADGPGFLQALDAVTSHPLRERLGGVRCPTLVVHGEDDRLIPVTDAGEFARLIPGARTLVYEDTGHLAMLEQPARFNADLLAFLSR